MNALLDVKWSSFEVEDAVCLTSLPMHSKLLSFSFIDVAASLMAMLTIQVYHGKLDFVCVDTPGDYYGSATSCLIESVLALNGSSSLVV